MSYPACLYVPQPADLWLLCSRSEDAPGPFGECSAAVMRMLSAMRRMLSGRAVFVAANLRLYFNFLRAIIKPFPYLSAIGIFSRSGIPALRGCGRREVSQGRGESGGQVR